MFPPAPQAAISRSLRDDVPKHLASSTQPPRRCPASSPVSNVFVQRRSTSPSHYVDGIGSGHASIPGKRKLFLIVRLVLACHYVFCVIVAAPEEVVTLAEN